MLKRHSRQDGLARPLRESKVLRDMDTSISKSLLLFDAGDACADADEMEARS